MSEYVPCMEIVDGRCCGMLAKITNVAEMYSTDGLIRHIGTKCLSGHILFMPASYQEDWATPETAQLDESEAA